MLEFTDQFRIYLIKHRRMVKWSIMTGPRNADLYLLGDQAMEAILSSWRSREGKATSDYGHDFFIQHKRVGKADEYVRLSISGQTSLVREYRCDASDMERLEAEYARQSSGRMPWDL